MAVTAQFHASASLTKRVTSQKETDGLEAVKNETISTTTGYRTPIPQSSSSI
jgi:hypothetical protein